MLRPILSAVLLLALGACAPKTSPSTPAPVEEAAGAQAAEQALPFDPDVRHGVLDNGMRYYVLKNGKPADRAVFRLAVEAGSVLEDPDQLGLAHFVEHMAFNGTTHFEGNDLIKYLEKTGTRFGAHLNAHTSFDETVYKLQVPTDDPEVFDQAFLILEDWAHGLTFDSEELEAERGVVLEEWRRSLGPWSRAREVTLPLAYAGSPYPDRLPIGTEESLKTFTHEAAVRYYQDWYRPDLMAIIAVGDFDPEAVEAKIVEHFGRVEAPESPRERARHEIPDRTEPEWVVFTDPELTQTHLTVETGHDWPLSATYGEYRDTFLVQAFTGILNERLKDVTREPESPVLGAGVWRGRRSPTEGSWGLRIQPQEGRALEAYERVLVEVERIQQHGVLPSELQRTAARMLRDMESYYNQRDTTESVRRADELVRHVTTGEAVPGIAMEWELAQRFIPAITSDEIQEVARSRFLPGQARVVSLLQPDKEGLEAPTVADLQAVEARVAALTIEPLEDDALDTPLIAELPQAGEVRSTRAEEAVGFTVWTLSNGAEVWLRPTDFEADKVEFRAYSIGGHNLVADEDYIPATTAAAIVRRSGLGAHRAPDLEKQLAGRKASVGPFIHGTSEGVTGSASPADLELLLQLTWLTFTEPRFDEDAFQQVKRDQLEQVRNRLANPRTPYHDAHNALMWQDFPRYRPWTLETVEAMDLQRSEAIYRDRFADASDFRFVFVGNFSPDTLQPLVEQYLAPLPAGRAEADDRMDLGARRISGRHEHTVHSGSEPQADVRIVLHGPFTSTFLNRNRLSALREVLSTRLREVLREELGGVYGVSVRLTPESWPEHRYAADISFVCDPDRVEELEQATFQVIEELRSTPVDAHYVESFQNKSLRGREESERTNSFWVSLAGPTLDLVQLTGEELAEVMDYEERVRSLTPGILQEMAQEVLGTDHVVVSRRLPDASGGEAAAQ